MHQEQIINSVKQWVDEVVVGLQLCPFAKTELDRAGVHFVLTQATSEIELLEALAGEIRRLDTRYPRDTSLLIHPLFGQDFDDYNQFLELAGMLLEDMGMVGVYQIASFHPHYQFAGTQPGDAENYTNRSPYPMLHLIREEELEKALAHFDHPEQVPQRNIQLLKSMGSEKMQSMLNSCLNK